MNNKQELFKVFSLSKICPIPEMQCIVQIAI